MLQSTVCYLLSDVLAKDSFANLPAPRGVQIRLVDAYTMDKDFVHQDRHVSRYKKIPLKLKIFIWYLQLGIILT